MTPQEIVLKKVKELYGIYGIRVFSMDDIARACGISKKTLYSNFENKYDLVQATVASISAQVLSEYRRLQSVADNAVAEVFLSLPVFEDIFRSINYRMINDLEKYYYEIWRKVESFRQQESLDFILANMKRGQDEGLYHQAFDMEIIARMRMHQFESVHRHITPADPLHNILHQVSLHYLTGLATPTGLDQINKYQSTYTNR